MQNYNELIDKHIEVEELLDMGLMFEDDNVINIEKFKEVLSERKIKGNDLAKAIGLPRQNINAILKGTLKPGLDFAFKVAFVLGLKVEDLFEITSSSWTSSVKVKDSLTVFYDFYEKKVITGKEKTKKVKSNQFLFFNTKTNERYTQKEYSDMLEDFISDNLHLYLDKAKELCIERNLKTSDYNLERIAKDLLKEIFNKDYNFIYKKIVKAVKPHILK